MSIERPYSRWMTLWSERKSTYMRTIDKTPKELLSECFGRTDIEVVFKTAKDYQDLLLLSKWTDTTVRGKILHDIINTTALLLFRKSMCQSGMSTSEIIGRYQSLMCYRKKDGIITVETPNKQVKEYYKLFGLSVPAHVKEEFCRKELGLKNLVLLLLSSKVEFLRFNTPFRCV